MHDCNTNMMIIGNPCAHCHDGENDSGDAIDADVEDD